MKHQEHRSETHYDLHSVHKTSASKIMKMKSLAALAPSGPPQPKVYKVKPIHFRELVQKLTGAQPQLLINQATSQQPPRYRRSNLQSVAPPPLPIHPHQLQLQLQTDQNNLSDKKQVSCKVEQDQKSFSDKKMQDGVGTTELILSPNFQAWFSFAMMSPGAANISQMEQKSFL
ncbi:hypothetical protein BVRB_6g128350 [Beta vulgaris subsp. vulgaris]|nr:hypothetical protein BVRB_6g128350 [Beta vulgaris subsp. vulgaris]